MPAASTLPSPRCRLRLNLFGRQCSPGSNVCLGCRQLFEKVQAINKFLDIDLVRHLTKHLEHLIFAYRHHYLLLCLRSFSSFCTWSRSPFLTLATPSASIPRIPQATASRSGPPRFPPSPCPLPPRGRGLE